jgi:hypothetical protein
MAISDSEDDRPLGASVETDSHEAMSIDEDDEAPLVRYFSFLV